MGSCTGKRCHCGNTYTMNPLFHLTGKGETVDRIIGLEKIGADDYLAKLEGVGTCSNP
jgi:DNA-binding response OmpR family regulator